MTQITIKYENEKEKDRLLEVISKGANIKHVSNPNKTGRYYRVYVKLD